MPTKLIIILILCWYNYTYTIFYFTSDHHVQRLYPEVMTKQYWAKFYESSTEYFLFGSLCIILSSNNFFLFIENIEMLKYERWDMRYYEEKRKTKCKEWKNKHFNLT